MSVTGELTYFVSGFDKELTYDEFKTAFENGKICNSDTLAELYELARTRNDTKTASLVSDALGSSRGKGETLLEAAIATAPDTELRAATVQRGDEPEFAHFKENFNKDKDNFGLGE